MSDDKMKRLKELIKAAVNGEPTGALAQTFANPKEFTREEREFVLKALEEHLGAKVTLDPTSQCYSVEYTNGEVSYTRGQDFKGKDVDDLTFRKFIKRDQANRARMKQEALNASKTEKE